MIVARATPDYYARTSGRVREWALSKGLWILLLNIGFTLLLAWAAARRKRPFPWVALAISATFTATWLLYPIFWSYAADGIYFRFP